MTSAERVVALLPSATEIVAALGCAPDRILFLDDNEINVLGARAAGLRSECVAGVAEARAILAQNELLRA